MPKQTNKSTAKSRNHDQLNNEQGHRGTLIATSRQFAYRSDPRVTMTQQQIFTDNIDDIDPGLESPLRIDPTEQSGNIPSSIMNAPTSLANLAQLSGISLVPVTPSQHSKRQTTINPIKQHTIDQMNANLPRNKKSPIDPTDPGAWSASLEDMVEPDESIITLSGPANRLSTFNLAAIPSIRLLNQTSLDSNYRVTSNNASKTKTSTKIPQKPKPNINKNSISTSKQANNRQTVSLDPILINGSSNNPPSISAGTSHAPVKSNSSLNNILTMAPELFPAQQQSETNYESNTVDIMKLMAIFNNPALTITPVSSSSAGVANRSTYCLNPMKNTQQVTSSELCIDRNRLKHLITEQVVHQPELKHDIEQSFNIQRGLQRGELQRSSIPQPTARVDINQHHENLSGNPNWLSNPSNLTKQELTESLEPQMDWNSTEHEDGNGSMIISAAARNFIMEQPPSGSSNLPTVSVQLLKHIANQTRENDFAPQDNHGSGSDKSIYEPECILSVPKFNIQQLCQPAKYTEGSHIVTSDYNYEKSRVGPIRTTKERLYIPRSERITKKGDSASSQLNSIRIESEDSRKLLLSDRHFMLDSMMSLEDQVCSKQSNIHEPDDIFVNRSKRVMSIIDTDMERRKRIRFQQISRRTEFKDGAFVTNESDDEIDDDFSDDQNVPYDKLIPIQLPLEEELTEDKRNHLSCIGLVSRDERNKITLEQCERKAEIYCQLSDLDLDYDAIEDAKRFVDMMLKTGGGPDIQLRTDSSIKRADLPFIEGLNRNSSRVKMTFMSVLGLEKKSKRTTLYKMKPSENSTTQITAQPQQVRQKVILPTPPPPSKPPLQPQTSQADLKGKPNIIILHPSSNLAQQVANSDNVNSRLITNQILQAAIMSCREALKIPSKDEYMKSLGLIDISS